MIGKEYDGAKPNKRLGQNFLIDDDVLDAITEAAGIKKGDVVVEIGPGHGELTQKLLARKPARIIAIEKDGSLAQRLVGSLAKQNKNLEIIEGDALDIIENCKLKIENSTNYKLVGNIPYYITGYLMRILGELKRKPSVIVLTMQREVAERIAAKPGKMNLLSASVQIWGQPEIQMFIGRHSFNPAPKVDSAIIKITPNQKLVTNNDPYYKVIKIIFKQPRKTVLNNLKDAVKNGLLGPSALLLLSEKHSKLINKRPQDLKIADLKALGLYFGGQ